MEEKDLYKGLSVGLVSAVAGLINFFLGIAIMTKGWGVQAHSWGWILGGGLSVLFVTCVLTGMMKVMFGRLDL